MRALAAAVAALALALALASAPGVAATGACAPQRGAIVGVPHSKVLAAKGATVVYRVRGRTADTWWACLRGSASRALIGTDDAFQSAGSEYAPNATLSRLHQGIGGWVFVVAQTGYDSFETCSKYAQYPCPSPSPTDRLLAVQAASGERGPGALTQVQTDTSNATGAGTTTTWSAIVVSGAAIAWLLRSQAYTQSSSSPPLYTLYGCVATAAHGARPTCTPRQYAQGTIAPASVALAYTTLSWTQNGQGDAATLP